MHHDIRKVAERWFEEVWNKGRREAIAEILLPDAVLHESGNDSRGPEGFYPYYDRLRTACSDIKVTVHQTIAEHDIVCVRWSCTMNHTGFGLGTKPTGRTLSTTGISILRVSGDRLSEGSQNWDMLGLMQQIEAMEGAQSLYVAAN